MEENDSINELSMDMTTLAIGTDQEVDTHQSLFIPAWRSGDFCKRHLRRVRLEVWIWGESVTAGASALGLKIT